MTETMAGNLEERDMAGCVIVRGFGIDSLTSQVSCCSSKVVVKIEALLGNSKYFTSWAGASLI